MRLSLRNLGVLLAACALLPSAVRSVCDSLKHLQPAAAALRVLRAAAQVVFDTGTPPTRLATGGIIWSEQQIGLRFSPWSVGGHPGDAWVLESFLLALETERLVAGEANLTLRLCPSLPESGLPSEECLEESFLLEAAQRVEAEWQPRKSFTVSQGTSYWLVMQGNATSPQRSFSWLDGDRVCHEPTTASAYRAVPGEWVLDAPYNTVPSLRVKASPATIVSLPRA